jgi:carbon-monoxide dehydrogenase large subunit
MNAPHPLPLTPSRQEDLRLVTGTGRFTGDWSFEGELHAAVIRSDRAHARIVALDLDAVRTAPGVVAVLTAQDVRAAGFGTLPVGAALTDRHGQPQRTIGMPLLADTHVHFLGQPIAMVIADTRAAAIAAAEYAAIDYEDLPAVVTVAQAKALGAPLLHAAVPGNLSLDFEHGDAAAVQAAFEAAACRTTLRVASQRLAGSPLEPRATVARHDAARDVTVVYTPTQGLPGMLGSLVGVTGWPAAQIEVVAQDVGGSFGLRGGTFSEPPLLMLAARRLGRPVKWVASRGELFTSEWHGRALALEGSIALDAQGRILAIRFDDEADLGAYNCYWGAFIASRNLAVTMGGVYRVPALHMRSRAYLTNTVPVSAYRGAGRPDIAFAIERLIEQAAHEHGFDRIALRRLNMVPADAFPYRTANGTLYDCGDFVGALDQALAAADYAGFAARRAQSAARGRLRGIGLGAYLEASGGAAVKDQVHARFAADGSLALDGMSGPSGQGHETSFTQIVADALGLPQSSVSYRAGDPSQALSGSGTGGSRTLATVGSACKAVAAHIVAAGLPHAARVLGVSPAEVAFVEGAYRGPGGASIGVAELARRLAGPSPHPLDGQGDAQGVTAFPNGCHVAEVEIDPDTGVIEVLDYVAIDDLGTVVSPQLVQGQVHGGVVQGAGQVFTEAIVYDEENGQLLTGSFVDYAMPRVGLVPRIRNAYHPVPTALNALGAKGVGESGCSGSLPALTNAVMDALRPAGVGHLDTPYTPARVWEALRAARARG